MFHFLVKKQSSIFVTDGKNKPVLRAFPQPINKKSNQAKTQPDDLLSGTRSSASWQLNLPNNLGQKWVKARKTTAKTD